jgi:hypothetical protein
MFSSALSRLVLGACNGEAFMLTVSPAEKMSITFMVVILHILAGKMIGQCTICHVAGIVGQSLQAYAGRS